MISDAKLKLILTLYKNDKLTFEEVKTLLQEDPKEDKFTGPFQPLNPWQSPYPPNTPIYTMDPGATSIYSEEPYIPHDNPSMIYESIALGYKTEKEIETLEKQLLGQE